MKDVELTKEEIRRLIQKAGSFADVVEYLKKNAGKDSIENLVRKYISN